MLLSSFIAVGLGISIGATNIHQAQASCLRDDVRRELEKTATAAERYKIYVRRSYKATQELLKVAQRFRRRPSYEWDEKGFRGFYVARKFRDFLARIECLLTELQKELNSAKPTGVQMTQAQKEQLISVLKKDGAGLEKIRRELLKASHSKNSLYEILAREIDRPRILLTEIEALIYPLPTIRKGP